MNGNLIGLDVHDEALEQNTPTHVRLTIRMIAVQIYHVAPPEIGQEVFALVRNGERDFIESTAAGSFLLRDGEAGIDIPHLLFLTQRHVPQVSIAAPTAINGTGFRDELFFQHEGHHTTEICFLQLTHLLQRHRDGLYLRQ